MRTVYNQKNTTLTIDGTTIQDFGEGTSITFTLDGGEVQKTQGTDGAGINIASDQGATLAFTLRENSRSVQFVQDIIVRQRNNGAGVTIVLRTGGDILFTMTDSFIGNPGELATGDKTQGTLQYTAVSASVEANNMSITSAAASGIA